MTYVWGEDPLEEALIMLHTELRHRGPTFSCDEEICRNARARLAELQMNTILMEKIEKIVNPTS